MEPARDVAEVLAYLEDRWKAIEATTMHPIDWLVNELPSAEAKKTYAKRLFAVLDSVSPRFYEDLLAQASRGDAMSVHIGSAGLTSVSNSGQKLVFACSMV